MSYTILWQSGLVNQKTYIAVYYKMLITKNITNTFQLYNNTK